MEFYRRKQSHIAVRHVGGDHVVAVIEVVSPGNKSSKHAFESFVEKAAELIDRGIHLLILDLFPPGPRDPREFMRSSGTRSAERSTCGPLASRSRLLPMKPTFPPKPMSSHSPWAILSKTCPCSSGPTPTSQCARENLRIGCCGRSKEVASGTRGKVKLMAFSESLAVRIRSALAGKRGSLRKRCSGHLLPAERESAGRRLEELPHRSARAGGGRGGISRRLRSALRYHRQTDERLGTGGAGWH